MGITAKTIADAITAKQRNKQLVAKTEKLEIELKRLRGQYADINEYKQDVMREVVITKTRLLAIPAKIAPRLHAAQSVTEVHQLLLTEIRDVLTELSEGTDRVGEKYSGNAEGGADA